MPEPHVRAASALPELSLQCGSLTILRDDAPGSDAILLGAERSFRLEIEHGLLRRLTVREFERAGEDTPIAVEMGLVRLKGRTPTPAGELLMDMIRAGAAEALDAGGAPRPLRASSRTRSARR